MVVGIDTSHIGIGRTGIAMVATTNKTQTSFYNKESILNEKGHKGETFTYHVSNFLEEAIQE